MDTLIFCCIGQIHPDMISVDMYQAVYNIVTEVGETLFAFQLF